MEKQHAEKNLEGEKVASDLAASHIDEFGLSWSPSGAVTRMEESEAEREKRINTIADSVRKILQCLGEDPDREGIKKTPLRYAKALLYLTRGYETQLETVVNEAIFQEKHDEMVIVRDITVHSLCEHHLLPFMGTINIGYIPTQDVIGLSKLARIADMFSQRLQVQERLTKQVANALMDVLKPKGVAVTMKAQHMCMCMRGANKPGSSTVTSSMLGIFRTNAKTREEFLNLCSS